MKIDQAETSKNSIRLQKAILAEKTKEERLDIWNKSEINKITDKTITDFKEFKIKIKKAQENGYAYDIEENQIGKKTLKITENIYWKQKMETKEKLEKELS